MSASEPDLLASVLAEVEATVRAVEPGQRALPTPCPGLDVARLTDHLVGWANSFASRLTDGADGADRGDPDAYVAGPQPADELHRAAVQMVAAHREGAEQAQSLPVGFLVMELLTHGWDLAVAIGRPVSYSAEAAELGLRTGRAMLEPQYRGPGKAFAAEVPVADSAPAVERLVAFLGRDPGWQPTVAG